MQRFSEFFHERGFKVREVARQAAIDPGSLSRYLSGQNVPEIDNADALGDVLGVSGRQVREMVKADKMARKLASSRVGVA